jgi:hypothetical protein
VIKFALGVFVGIIVSDPLMKLVNEHLTPPVRRKITENVTNLANRLNKKIEETDK